MKKLKIAEVASKLSITQPSLYKIIKTLKIEIEKTSKGRYIWNESAIKKVKDALAVSKYEKLEASKIKKLASKHKLRIATINNRRYLGNKYSIRDFIREIVEANCKNVNIIVDIFSGTGSVADVFKDKMLVTNDLLYSNYISNYAWFSPEKYSATKVINYIIKFNQIEATEENYMSLNFSNTFFSAKDCRKIGYVRELIDTEHARKAMNFKEYAILVTSLLYGMDRIANTVGHYDAYIKNGKFDKKLKIPLLLPNSYLNENNQCYNEDANCLVERLESDLLYLDPPYNSRQYSDAYHLLENVASWRKPEVFGVAKKMNRKHIKSEYCLVNATEAFENLIKKANTRYILLSYNNMGKKGNDRSNAKISDDEIMRILKEKGKVSVFEKSYKSFSTGKTKVQDNTERLFLCETFEGINREMDIACPFNYTGGKYKLLPQIKPLLAEASSFIDLFAGGCNVSINSKATKIICNDSNSELVALLKHFKKNKVSILLYEIEEIIKKYNLSRTDIHGYEYYKCNSGNGLAPYNKERYLKLRADFNRLRKQGETPWTMLYVLIVYSFNNQIRFNKNGEFNLPVGKRDFNIKMRTKLVHFCEAIKKRDVSFLNKDFRKINLSLLDHESLIYCDPPYLITNATYNESGQWTEKDERDLLVYLDKANSMGFKFALSNVLQTKNKENEILISWLQKNKFKVYKLKNDYSNSNYQRKDKPSYSNEVLIINY